MSCSHAWIYRVEYGKWVCYKCHSWGFPSPGERYQDWDEWLTWPKKTGDTVESVYASC